jgi:hypothetical protein
MLPASTTSRNDNGHGPGGTVIAPPSGNGRPTDLRALYRLPDLVEDLDGIAAELVRLRACVDTLTLAAADLDRRAEAKRRRDRRYRQHKRHEVIR